MRWSVALVALTSSVASADTMVTPWTPDTPDTPPNLGVLLQPTAVISTGDGAPSYGGGAEVAFMPYTRQHFGDVPSSNNGVFYLGAGVLATRAGEARGKIAHDLYALQLSAGAALKPALWFMPFGTVGLDPLVASSRAFGGARQTGATIGASARVGLMGYVGRRVVYSVTASFLGAIAPGFGDNAGGLVLQAAIGWRFGIGDGWFW